MFNPLLIGLASGGALLLSFLLFNHPKNNNITANKWLGVFVATFACAMLEIFLHNLGLQTQYPALLDLMEVSRFLSAPTLYLSVVFFTAPAKTFKVKLLWHFTPFLVFFLFQLPHLLTGNNIPISNRIVAHIVFSVFAASLPIQTIIYWLLSYKKLKQHQQNIKQVASSTEAIDLSWLVNFLYVLAAVILIWLNLAFFNMTGFYDYTPFLYLASVYFLAYFSLRQKEIYAYSTSALKELDSIIGSDIAGKTEKQKRLSETQVQHLNGKLEQLMQVEKVFLDNNLSLPFLAKKMEISIHELSYLINDLHGENFFSYVNKYRVEEAKRLLLSDKYDQFNILGIAYQSGFNSKTSFNTSFKKWTGQSPTEFIQSAKRQNF